MNTDGFDSWSSFWSRSDCQIAAQVRRGCESYQCQGHDGFDACCSRGTYYCFKLFARQWRRPQHRQRKWIKTNATDWMTDERIGRRNDCINAGFAKGSSQYRTSIDFGERRCQYENGRLRRRISQDKVF